MASKYQSAIDKLRKKQQEEDRIKKTNQNPLKTSAYSSVYEKLGKISGTSGSTDDENNVKFFSPNEESKIPSRASALEIMQSRQQREQERMNQEKKDNAFVESEKQEAEKRKIQQEKRAEAIKNSSSDIAAKIGDLAANTENKNGNLADALGYISARNRLAMDQFGENAQTFVESNVESWLDSAKKLPSELKSLLFSPSEALETSYGKYKSGEAAEEKDKSITAAYERAAERNTIGKRAEEIEKKYEAQSSNPVVKGIADLTSAITYMLPNVAVSAIPVVGQVAGAGMLYATSAPEAYIEARNEGANTKQALNYSRVEGINQSLGDLLIGGIAGTGKGILSEAADTVTKGASTRLAKRVLGKLATSPAGKTAVKYFGEALGEGVEESLQSLTSTLNKRLTYDPDAKVNWKDVAYEGLIGSLMGGVYGAFRIPSDYKAYKSDVDIVNNFAKAASSISSDAEDYAVHSVGEFIVEQMDETMKNAGEDSDLKERAEFIGGALSDILDGLDENGADIIQTNNEISDAVESIASSPAGDIIENTARLTDVVADTIEPDANAVNATIDVVRDLISNAKEETAAAQTREEKLESQINEEVLKQIDSTLRNNRDEVEKAREELPENNLTVPENSDIVESANNTSGNNEASSDRMALEYTTQKHTKTGETLNVLKIPSHVDSAEYTRIKNQIKKIGGYYSTFAKGFIIPEEGMAKAGDILGEIGLDLKGYPAKAEASVESQTANANETTDETKTTPKPASLTYPDGIKAADKTAFTRMFKKWAANEYVNITDMTSDSAAEFASFASKLYSAGYNGIKPIGNYANLTDNELVDFPYFLQDTFYNLGKKARGETNTDEQGVKTEAAASKAESAAELDKGENIPGSGIEMQKDGDDYSAKHQQVIDEYADAVDTNLRAFIDDSIDGKNKPNATYQLSNINTETAEKIEKAIGINPDGWQTKIEARMIQHIWKRHGENGQQDHSMKNRDDIARIQYVIDNADSIERTDNSKAYREKHPYIEGKSRTAKSVLLSKKVNGTYYVVEAIPDSDKKTAYIVTSFMSNKKTVSTADNVDTSPAYTSAGNDVNTLSDNQTPATISNRSEASIADDTSVPTRVTSTSQSNAPGDGLGFSDSIITQSETKVNTSSPEIQIADYVENKLANGEKIETKDLQETANSAFGGTQAEGKYDVKSMTDAMELGVNKRLISLIEENRSDFNSSNPSDAVESIREINEDILSQIPTQTKRSEEQVAMQQFSTPPNIAYVAAWAANIDGNDSVLEPSAGIGGLASFAKAFGAEVTVNELSERRLELLKNLPFDAFYNENAEQINNILPDSVKPTVVLMNPPFSANGRTKNTTKNAIPHIEQALLRLEDGGRLVAIVGRGMADDSATFKNWWNELRNEYDIRANIGINGENYRKYGTTFDVQLVVIDKTGPQKGETVTGYYDNLEDIPEILKGVRNDRTRTNEGNKTAERNTSVSGGETTGVKEVSGGTRTDTGGGSVSVSGRSDTGGRFGMEVSDADSAGDNGRSGMDVENSGLPAEVQPERDIRLSDDGRGRGRLEGGTDTGSNTDQRAGRLDSGESGSGTDGQSGGVVQAESGISGAAVEDKPKKSGKKASANDDGVYAEYKTVPLTVKNAKKHPAKLVESSAMSAVSSPKLTYVPKLDQSLIDSGALSDAQLENISYAGQAHEQKLPSGERKGYFIGDGTGVGKGRQIAGIIMDEWNRGRKKAIWVSENKNLSEDARRDWKDLGGDVNDIVDWEKVQKKGLPDKGILFIPYSSLAGKKGVTRSRDVEEIIADWFGKDYDGVIVYDEAHNMGNLIPIKGARGSSKASQKAISGNKLQSDLPNARVVYASATGATNIQNLAFAARLGLWGEGTSFVNNSDFANKIARAGIAAMELVARDMKAMGVYLARSISYEGVKYSTLQHKLTSDQRMMYDGMSKGWQVVLQNFDRAMAITNSTNSADVKKQRGQIYGSMQLFYNQILTSMSMPAVIKDIEKRLADGKSCVIQLVNTNESAQEKAVSESKSDGKSNLDDIDLTPRQLLIGYVENAFPVEQHEDYIDDNGNKASRVAVDSSGKPIINKQAQKMKEELIAQLNEISIPEGPLDMLLNHFGADNVAEITGRRGRVLTVTDENGNEHKQYVKRDSAKANIAEAKDFQDGKKRILVFSNAGSTGRSFHSDLRAKNQQQRIHYVLQPGWKADTAVQGFGRTHRSNQANTPEYVLVSTDVMGHKRFVTSIARRLDQLGALTKGQRQTGSGIFGEKDNLESPLSSQALREFYRRLGNGRIPGLDAQDVLGKMGLDKTFYDEFGRFKINEDTASDITKFLNRLLALPVEEQNKVFTAFEDIRDSYYQAALENGTLDMGLENVKADKVEIKQDDVVYTDSVTGAETRYVKATLYRKPDVLNTVEAAEGYHDSFKGLYRMQDGSVRAAYRLADKTDELGRVNKYYLLVSPNTSKQSRYIESTLNAKTEAIPKEQWSNAWADEVKSVPEYNENDIHMITGALLPIWDRLPETGIRAQRITTEDGTSYLGRIINKDMIDSTLRGLGVNAVKQKYTGSQVYDEIMKNGKTATMKGTNGGTLTISKRRVSGENRIEVSGSNTFLLPSKYDGIFSETINYSKRYFIPTGDKGIAILEKMLGDLGGIRSLDSDDGGAYYSLGTSRGKWGSGGRDSQVMSISELTRQAKNIFGVEINTGKVGKKGASGVFKTHAGTIRTRVYGDIPTISHELGHWFDKKYNLRSSPALSELTSYFRSDLKDAGYADSLIPSESIAEYFASYFKDKGKTEQKFKKFTKWLYENLSDRDLRKLYDYAGMTNAYFAADLERRADAQIHTRTDDGSVRSRAQMQLDALKQNPSAYMGTLSRKFTYLFIDDLADLKNFGKAYDLAMLEKNCASVVAGRLSYMFRDNNGKVIGKSLHAILSDGSINDMNRLEFDKYLVACRALDQINAAEKAKPGENAPTMVYGDAELQDKDSIMSRIEEYERSNPTFHDTAEEIYGYGRHLLYVSVQAGLISEELMNALIEKYPHHVPLNRVMETVVTRDGKVKRGYADQKAPIMKFKGSGRDIYSPIENLMLHTEQITKACMRNKVMSEFADSIDSHEDFGWAAEKVPASKVYTTVSTEAITERLKNFGTEKINRLNPMEAEEIIDDVLSAIGGYVGEWKTAPKQGKNIVSVMREGKPTYYEIHDKDLLNCLTALDDASMNMIVKALGGATAEFKVLTTGSNPIFAVTNVQRDLQSGYVSSSTTNDPFKYTWDFAKSFVGALKKSDSYKEYISLGGGYSDAISYDVSRLKRSKNEVINTTSKLKATTNKIGGIISDLVDAGEVATRLAEFERARKLGIDALEAVRKSQEISVNFARGGKVVKEIDKFIPYFRASVNSMYHLFDILTKGSKKELASRWTKFVGINAVMALMNLTWQFIAPYLFGEDEDEVDEAYETLSNYNKNAYWCYYTGDGKFFRIAKPKDMTVPATVIQRMVECYALGDVNALYGLGGYVLDSLCPSTEVMIFGTALDLAKNETFTGAPIVPQAYQNLAPALQYSGSTSKVSTALGGLLNVSPMKLDYILTDNTGYVGQLITNLLRNDGKVNLGFLNKFSIDSVYSTDEANIFYDRKEKYDTGAASYKATFGENEKYSSSDVYGSYKYAKIASTYSSLNKFMKAEGNKDLSRSMKSSMNDFLKAVNDNPTTELDKAVMDIAETTGAVISDIAPYVVIPDTVTYQSKGYKEKFDLSFDEMLQYYTESQIVLNAWYEDILNSGYSDEEMAEAMKSVKNEIAKQMRDRWEEIKFNQKYN